MNPPARSPFIMRPMRLSDLSALSSIHIQQFPGNRSSSLGRPFLRKMYRWFLLNQPHLAIVAEQDGHPIGFVVGALGRYDRKMFRYALPEVILGFIRNPMLLLKENIFHEWRGYLSALVPSRSRPRPNPSFAAGGVYAGLASIAVEAGMQGQGVGRALLEAFEESAGKSGATVLGLSVEKDNCTAWRLYEKCGWQMVDGDPQEPSQVFVKKLVIPGKLLT